jgi:hypothetical protein
MSIRELFLPFLSGVSLLPNTVHFNKSIQLPSTIDQLDNNQGSGRLNDILLSLAHLAKIKMSSVICGRFLPPPMLVKSIFKSRSM